MIWHWLLSLGFNTGSLSGHVSLWRPIIRHTLERSPPIRSCHLSDFQDPPAPWDPSFGLTSAGRNLASRETWHAQAFGSEACEIEEQDRSPDVTLAQFEGAQSFYQLYWAFVKHFANLLGWWLGDVPSYGMAVRITFDPAYVSRVGSKQIVGPAFVCQKLHIVNRLYGLGASEHRNAWMSASGLNAAPSSNDGTSMEKDNLSIDLSTPGVKTETLWSATWYDCKMMQAASLRNGRQVGQILWRGGVQSNDVHTQGGLMGRGLLGQPSIVARARALASQMVFGHDEPDRGRDDALGTFEDLEAELGDGREGIYGHGVSLSQIIAASAVDAFENGQFDDIPNHQRTIQQRSGNRLHTVYLPSGAICTAPSGKHVDGGENANDRLSLTIGVQKLYEGSDTNMSRAFGLNLANFLPLPPIDFPPPALLPLIRDLDEGDTGLSERIPAGSSRAFEEFLDLGTGFCLPYMQMEPCPPYRPWPHLSQPLPSGVRFVPVHSPPWVPLLRPTKRIEHAGNVTFSHPAKLDPHLDPGGEKFDWGVLNGLYSMTYGPWGQELIYIRTRTLTIHDFAPDDLSLSDNLATSLYLPWSRPTGPHGTGHQRAVEGEDGPLEEGLHWQPEPYIDISDLELPPSYTTFIRPGCRVVEGIKCTGDANVPRGTVSFRAFSRGQSEDECVPYFPPELTQARHSPWDGTQHGPHGLASEYEGSDDEDMMVRRPPALDSLFRMHPIRAERTPAPPSGSRAAAASSPVTPGRIMDCATGRLAMEGFVNAGCWRRCSVKIVSPDEINVHWHALHKVAVAKRLTAC